MQTEPAQIVGYITGGAAAIITLLVAFNVNLDETQQKAILGVVAVVAPVIASLVIRSKVFSPATTKAVAEEAAQTGHVPAIVK